jgi:hypothetical protein
MVYTQRKECLLCKSTELEDILHNEYSFPLGNFVVNSPHREFHFLPYNVQICKGCSTVQTKYIGDIHLIYEHNFAGAFGTIRNSMNELFADFILENTSISQIVEVGAGNGGLSESILDRQNLPYTIVDPSYCGPTEKREVISRFFESMDMASLRANTVVMSQVFEHFYDPCKIIETIQDSRIDYIYISWPDLESFIKNGVYHVLNPEHTFYVENEFLVELFREYNFTLGRTFFHKNHSVFFEFIRSKESIRKGIFPRNKKTLEDTQAFYRRVFQNIQRANFAIQETTKPVYVWPCSMHTLFCIALGLKKDKIVAVLDNSPLKIGKYLYGYSYECKPFNDIIQSPEPKIVLLTGGCYNTEIQSFVEKNTENEVFIL